MPQKWGKKEKELVRGALIQSGKKLFQAHGLQKTTVEEIARDAHISKGAFYSFFHSKEELYLEVLRVSEREFREELGGALKDGGKSSRENFRLFLEKTMDTLEVNQIYSRLTNGEWELLERKLSKGKLPKTFLSDPKYFLRYFKASIKKGSMRRIKPAALNGVMLLLVYFVLRKNEVGDAFYQAAKGLMVDMMVEYLIPDK